MERIQLKRHNDTLESDPNGLDQHAGGAKLDAGKNRVSLVLGAFANALWHVSLVGTYGANKYSPNGWLEVDGWEERYDDAQMRHWLKTHMGEHCDPDTNLLHMAHEAWNSLARLERTIRESKANRLEPIAADNTECHMYGIRNAED